MSNKWIWQQDVTEDIKSQIDDCNLSQGLDTLLDNLNKDDAFTVQIQVNSGSFDIKIHVDNTEQGYALAKALGFSTSNGQELSYSIEFTLDNLSHACQQLKALLEKVENYYNTQSHRASKESFLYEVTAEIMVKWESKASFEVPFLLKYTEDDTFKLTREETYVIEKELEFHFVVTEEIESEEQLTSEELLEVLQTVYGADHWVWDTPLKTSPTLDLTFELKGVEINIQDIKELK